jgi:hypothetical protein
VRVHFFSFFFFSFLSLLFFFIIELKHVGNKRVHGRQLVGEGIKTIKKKKRAKAYKKEFIFSLNNIDGK